MVVGYFIGGFMLGLSIGIFFGFNSAIVSFLKEEEDSNKRATESVTDSNSDA